MKTKLYHELTFQEQLEQATINCSLPEERRFFIKLRELMPPDATNVVLCGPKGPLHLFAAANAESEGDGTQITASWSGGSILLPRPDEFIPSEEKCLLAWARDVRRIMSQPGTLEKHIVAEVREYAGYRGVILKDTWADENRSL